MSGMGRLHRQPMVALIDDIASERLAEGDWLPKEVDIARRFAVSRGVARECIRALEERGLVCVRHGRGAAVASAASWDALDPDVLAALLVGPNGATVLRELIECQTLVEAEAVPLAAARAGRETAIRLAAAAARMAGASGTSALAARRFADAELGFHRTLVAATGNRALDRLARSLDHALHTARLVAGTDHATRAAAAAEHRRIAATVRMGAS